MLASMQSMLALGLMSGTSADGVDAALIETDGERILGTGAALTLPYHPTLRRCVLAVMADPDRAEHDPLGDLEAAVTQANLEAARALLAKAGHPAVGVVGLHGQTVLHRPERRFTRQIGDGAALHAALGVPVVNRFRDADVASGGQGAPLVPLFHRALLHDRPGPIAVLNLGGVANITAIDGDELLAFDTGPANALIDDWMARHTGTAFDADGRLAASGRVDAAALAALLAHPFFDRLPPKSLDRNAFSLAAVAALSPADGAATLTAFTAHAVGRARLHLRTAPRHWFVGGGGRHNSTLMAELRRVLAVPVESVDRLGWDGDALEAQAFGFLAVRALRGLPLSLPGTTGVPRPMPGGVVHR
ncbi:MAG: anhydro-N-acetylmuramic acid kinase [Acetobacteraceae bacterium]